MRFYVTFSALADREGDSDVTGVPGELRKSIQRILNFLLRKYSATAGPHEVISARIHADVIFDDKLPNRCRNCGRIIPDNAQFCSVECRSRPIAEYAARCGYCGMPVGAVFQPCPVCRRSRVEMEVKNR